MSLDADHESVAVLCPTALVARPVGVDGGVVSGQTAVVTLLAGETEVANLTIPLTDAASEKGFVMAIDQPASVDYMTITTDGDSVHLSGVNSLLPK